MSYAVGQVLFIVLRKEATIYPMQVVEEITKKTLEGELTTYMVRGQDAAKQLVITEIDGEIFDSADEAKAALVARVTATISDRVDAAVAKAREWYPTGFESSASDPMAMIKKATPLGEQQQPQQQQPKNRGQFQKKVDPRTEVAQLAAELRAESEETMMEVPDGKGGTMMAKVKSLKLAPHMQG